MWKNERIDNNLNPVWKRSRIPMMNLCNFDIDRPLKVDIWDYESSGRHQAMGSFQSSARGLLESRGTAFDVIEADKKAKSKSYVNSGTFIALNSFIERHPSFADVRLILMYILNRPLI